MLHWQRDASGLNISGINFLWSGLKANFGCGRGLDNSVYHRNKNESSHLSSILFAHRDSIAMNTHQGRLGEDILVRHVGVLEFCILTLSFEESLHVLRLLEGNFHFIFVGNNMKGVSGSS